MKYVNTREKINDIMRMDAKSYKTILNDQNNPFIPEILEQATIIGDKLVEVEGLNDKRINTTTAAQRDLAFFLNKYQGHSDVFLKTLAVRLVFADESFYQAVSDMPATAIALAFNTNVETVECKKVLDAHLQKIAIHNDIAEVDKVLKK